MCGIVAYFGSAPDSVARLVTGMSAIIYRAPDSTGMGKFGNISHSIVQRKNLGSVAGLFDVLQDNPFHENPDKTILDLWQTGHMTRSDMQGKLIAYEGLSPAVHEKQQGESAEYPSIEELVRGREGSPVSVSPGFPGRPDPLPDFRVKSRNNLRFVVRTMAHQYNLSFVAIKAIFRRLLKQGIHREGEYLLAKADASDVLNVFDYLFQKIFEEFRYHQPVRQSYKRVDLNPHARKYLWHLLKRMEITIPEDFDTDGISNLFRLLDAALVSRIPHDALLESRLQELLDSAFANAGMAVSPSWRSLYAAEKGVNLYGRAAGAVLEWLQKNELLQELSASIYAGTSNALSSPFGMTGGRCLDFIMQPVIAQGRWALQSSVTLTNAHPFTDEKCKRTIALNGQFSSEIEEELSDFLTSVASFSFRSSNSSEYFALLWGYYYKILKQEKARFQEVKDQVEKGLEAYAVGSNSINYQIFRQVQNRSDRELDELAFIEAAKKFTGKGGQIAAAGISIKSPRTLYAVSCNRPLFIVKRRSTDDFMVVSDINAAMGLFHQSMIIDVTTKYETLIKEKDEILHGLKESGALVEEVKKAENDYAQRIEEVLSVFAVEVYALEGEEVFARISTCFRNGGLMRELRAFDFNGRILHRIEPKSINLTPPHVHKDLDKSFFESHLEEVPTLLENQLGTKFLEDGSFSRFPINITPLKRKFGKKLKNLDRIILVGMGTSNHASMFAAGFAKTLLKKVQVVCIEPVQVDMLSRLIDPERDFVLLVSWSATTAEMVKIARDLLTLNVLFAGVTEKTFGDMALVAKKSCGIVPMMSGEEVTVPAVKSTFCSVMAVDLFMLWLCSDFMELELDQTVSGSIKQIPGVIRQVLSDPAVKQCAEKLSVAHAGVDMFVVIDALHTRGCGHEAAMKMEELTWSVMAKGIDYRDIEMDLFYLHNDKTFLIVNATDRERILEAVEVMSFLDKEEIPFFAVTYEGSRLETVEQLSHGNLLVLPKCEDCFQPFADLVFYYMLAFYSARARGRRADDYPRNRAKSVTTSRSVVPAEFSPAGELFNVRHREELLSNLPVPALDVKNSLAWEENQGFTRQTREYFSLMKNIAGKLAGENPLDCFVSYEEQAMETFSHALFDRERDLELLFFPMDNTADAAVRNTVGKLFRFLPCRMRVFHRGEALDSVKGDAIIMAVASFSQSLHFPNELDRENISDLAWFGPQAIVEGMEGEVFSMGRYIVNSDFERVDGSALYAGLALMLIKAWRFSEPDKAADLETHFKRSGQMIGDILNDTGLARDAARVMAANGAYRTMLYLSPPDGTGLDFTKKFDKAGKIATKNIFFGEAAHGSLVTVDNRVEEKFIQLTTRSQMVQEHGADRVTAWEKTYMNGEDIDSYLENLTNDLASRVESPFFAEGSWYLPLLKPGYSASEDNLIVVDATSERYFDQAADDLAVFGCRHARLIVITQEAFLGVPEKRSIQKFPLAGMLKIPSFTAKGQSIPVSDLHLPFAVVLVSAAMAGMEDLRTTVSPQQ